MEEKKLTDEEVVKALELCVKNDCEKCPYLIKGFDCVISKQAENDFLDLIHRLQDENKKLEKDVHDMSWIIKVHKYCVGADHCQNSSTREYELQKQVDELTAEITEMKSYYSIKGKSIFDIIKEKELQAEKDTAKDIIKWIKRNGILEYGGYVIHDSTIEQMCKKYGVEVE